MPETSSPTQLQLEAIEAAIRRVYPDITGRYFSEEMAWAIRDLRYEKDGSIHWRAMRIGELLLASISETQNHRCYYCGIETVEATMRKSTFEHLVKKSEGGLDHPHNLVMACYACNSATFNQAKAVTN